MDRVHELIGHIKAKKELANLDDNYVLEKIEKAVTPKIKTKLENAKDVTQFLKSKEYDELKTKVRKSLRETYGVFQREGKDREELLQKLPDEQAIREILALHQSTKERLPYYEEFYAELKKKTGELATILDIGCGLNPVSYPMIGYNPTYVCSDVSLLDMEFLEKYFTKMHLSGEVYPCDALEHDKIVALAQKVQPDAIFLLKLVDTLEAMERHTSKKLMAKLGEHTTFLVVTFATASLGGRKEIPDSRRTWFENFLEKMEDWTHEVFSVPNEKVYVVRTK